MIEYDDSLQTSLMESATNEHANRFYDSKRTFFKATGALAACDFEIRRLLKTLLKLFGVICLVVGQEAFFIYFFTLIRNDPVNYNEVELTWEENSPPILAFYNAETPLGQSTESLIELYNDILNEEVDQVKLEESTWVPEADLSVEEVMAEAAAQYYELAEEAESGGHHESQLMPKSGHGEGEAFGAYYFYELDESTNTYSIGVYGN